ncbi:MAG TPA: type IV toxin-antitoxin system AbiEi family antitoxin domain-containing protein [Thermoleophilaceae bacterium]
MDRPGSLPSSIGTQSTPVERDRRIAEIANAQWTMISLADLTGLGLTASAVRNRVAAGRLHRRHRGVYSVGHEVIPWQGHVMAAVLACGEGAVASHHAAARLHGLLVGAGARHVTVPGRRVRVPGVEVHRTHALEPWQRTREQRIPCTAWPRTIVDVAGRDGERAAERMIDRAEQLRVFDLSAIRRELDHRPGRKGARNARAALGMPEPAWTRNDLEEAFYAISGAAGLPRPHVNMPIVLDDGGPHVEADFAWPELKLIVETDGWETHGTRRAFGSDRRRDRRLDLAGWRVLRFTWHEVMYEPAMVARELAARMALAAS